MSNLEKVINELFQAVQTDQAERLKEIVSANPALANTENSDGLTPLGFAAHYGNMRSVQVLLDYGAEVNAISHSKISFIPSNTALHAAIAGERSLDVIRLLLEQGADPNLFDSNGHTSLHTAAFHDDNTELIHLLIQYGADLHANVDGGVAALDLALKQGNKQVAHLLGQLGTKKE